MRVLITGGVKSGKSSYALSLADQNFEHFTYVATAIPFDDEMKQRIAVHRRERGDKYRTIEEPVAIHTVVGEDTIVDDITVWMNNLFYKGMEESWKEILEQFITNLPQRIIVITNETGLGNIPPDRTTRAYNRYLGEANIMLANAMDTVYFMVAGIPLKVK